MSDSSLAAVAAQLTERGAEILDLWEQRLPRAVKAQTPSSDLRKELNSLYEALVFGFQHGSSARDESFEEARALLSELSISRARHGFSPTETAASVFTLKNAVFEVFGGHHLAESLVISAVIDDLGLFTFEQFVAAREAVIANQTEQLLELSTPVVKLWDGVLAVPLVGTLDSARTQVVMETLLQMLVDTGSAHAIIDITGVAAVDTQVAQHLLKTVVAARLMGADCIISGIRPQIAQTVVALGIQFGDIPTKATLADALRHVLSQAGFDIVRRADRPV
ncbi:MAG: anti-anti-sigma factor [Acidimicrobiia bacterium]|nr:anti-anti-sigma factor [Acidimicrobiia bacterium]